jgi:hypothetical protein
MSWDKMSGYDVYGIDDDMSNIQTDVNVYDVNGKMLQRAIKTPDILPPPSISQNGKSEKEKRSRKNNSCNFVVIAISLIIAVGAGYYFGRLCRRNSEVVEMEEAAPENDSNLRVELTKEFEDKIQTMEKISKSKEDELKKKIKELEKSLESKKESAKGINSYKFDEKYRIDDFHETMKKLLPQYKNAMILEPGAHRFRELRKLFDSLEQYVEFVNKCFPRKQKED